MTAVKQYIFSKRFISFLLCLVILLTFLVFPQPRQIPCRAEVLTLTSGVIILIATLLLVCGIYFASSADAREAITDLWNKMSADMQTTLLEKAVNGDSTSLMSVVFSASFWQQFKDFVKGIFSIGQTKYDIDIASGFLNFDESDSINPLNLPIFFNATDLAVTYTSKLNNVDVSFYTSGSYSYLQFTSGSGDVYRLSRSYTGNGIICREPVVINYDNGRKGLMFYVSYIPSNLSQYLADFRINGVSPYVDTLGFYLIVSGNKQYLYYFPDNVHRSYTGFFYDLLVNSSFSTIGLTVDDLYYPDVSGSLCPDVPLDGSISIPVPATLPAVVSITSADVIASSVVTTADPPLPIPDDMPDLNLPSLIITKFPFCLPFDLYNAFSTLVVPAEPPVFDLVFPLSKVGLEDEVLTIDFSEYNNLASISRWGISIIFVIGLILATRKLIGA